MNFKKTLGIILVIMCLATLSAQQNAPLYQSKAYTIFPDKVVQRNFEAKALSNKELTSNYRSPEADKCSPTLTFKFSINGRDNEMPYNQDHRVTLKPINGKYVTDVVFGKQLSDISNEKNGQNLSANTVWTVRLDMRAFFRDFQEKGFFLLANGEKLYSADFKGVYIAGNALPLIWDFNNLHTKPELELKDADGDHIYETTLIMNQKENWKTTGSSWKLSKNISAFPQYNSDYPISDAIYNLSLEEMENAVEKDSTLRTGKEWAGVWTRDVSYSIILSMAYMQSKVAQNSLMRKVKNGRIVQDTGTGGAYPVSTDRMIWAVAAWEIYKVTGDADWLKTVYPIVKKSLEEDLKNVYDKKTGLAKGESSFLDWREQTYPRWMQPADIYQSQNLGANAAHYKANKVLAEMAELLGDKLVAEKFNGNAEKIKNGINNYLWLKDKNYYAQYLYGRNYQSLSPRSEALGEALCVLFGIADNEKQKLIVANVPVMDYGIPCIYPQIPNIPPYHNNAVWPFVQTYWALASAKAGNEASVLHSFVAIYRAVALFLTNKENFVAETGDFAGTQINSSNMLWSLSGNLALVHKILFGMEFGADSLNFHPFVPQALKGKRSLTNFKYRNTVLNIEMEGFGNGIARFELDGKVCSKPAIPYTLKGLHTIKIILKNNKMQSEINQAENYTTIETPEVKYANGKIIWNKINGTVSYTILKNAQYLKSISANSFAVIPLNYAEYQLIAVDKNNVGSFASEPVPVVNNKYTQTYEIEDYAPKSSLEYKNYSGKGFVEISKTENKSVVIPININKSGTYLIKFRYSNGNGPINTENKCAIRTFNVNGKFVGTLVFPQRGKEEWSNWGYSNDIQMFLSKGENKLEIKYESQNENMNGEINQAMLDMMEICFLK